MSAQARFLRFHAPVPRLLSGVRTTLARRVGGHQLGRALRIAGRPSEIKGSFVGLRRWDGNAKREHPIS